MARTYEYKSLTGEEITAVVRKRFWAKVDKTDGCWLWSAGTIKGYGNFSHRYGETTLAHRVAYAIMKGDVPARMAVGQTCENRLCVRPKHLVLRSFAERGAARGKLGTEGAATVRRLAQIEGYRPLANLFDASVSCVAKANLNVTYHDPSHVPARPWLRRAVTAEQAEEMIADFEDGDSMYAIANERGLSYSLVWEIVNPDVKRKVVDGRRRTVRV